MTRSQPTLKGTDKIEDFSLRQKLTKSLAVLTVLSSSTQLGHHLWPDSAFVYGVRVDYLAPTLYMLDIAMVSCVLLMGRMIVVKLRSSPLMALLPLCVANGVYAVNPVIAFLWMARCVLYALGVSALIKTVGTRGVALCLIISMLFQVLLGVVQVGKGSAIQGPFYFLGERAVNVGTPMVAKANWFGETVLRAYGTFSHPNIMAGWLVVACVSVVYLTKQRWWKELALLATVVGLVVTQSRAALFTFLAWVVPFRFLYSTKSRLMYGACIGVLVFVFYQPLSGALLRSETSVSERVSLQKVSMDVVSTYPFFGTGANAAIATYPAVAPSLRSLQPDHNSLTLLLSWFGLVGLGGAIYVSRVYALNLRVLLPLLPLLLVDHYFLTAHQGLFILLLYFHIATAASGKTPRVVGS